MTEAEVRKQLERACEVAGGQKAWAIQAGVSAAYVNDVLSERRSPGRSILDALGISKTINYKRNAA